MCVVGTLKEPLEIGFIQSHMNLHDYSKINTVFLEDDTLFLSYSKKSFLKRFFWRQILDGGSGGTEGGVGSHGHPSIFYFFLIHIY